MPIFILIVKVTLLVAVAGSISASAAYLCLMGHRTKAFAAANVGYLFVAALLMAGAFYKLDPIHFFEALVAVGPLVLIPGVLLSFCVSGKLTKRAVIPIAFVAAFLAFPVTICSSFTASCHILKTVDTCL